MGMLIPEMSENYRELLSRSKWQDNRIKNLWPESEEYRENRVLYLGPFREPYNTLYSELIAPLIGYYELECHRDDEDALSQPFFERILEKIKTSRFILINLSENRPSVLIELGWVTAMANQCLIFTTEERPSNIAHISIPKYKFSLDGLQGLEHKIVDALLQAEVIKEKKEPLDINFESIIEANESYELIKTKTVLLARAGNQEEFDITVKIPLGREADVEEVNLTPVDMSLFDRQKKKGAKTPFSIIEDAMDRIHEDFESYKKRCEAYNAQLADLPEETINDYIISYSIFRSGSETTFSMANYGEKTLNGVHLEIEFPESFRIIDESYPEPSPPLEKPIRESLLPNMSGLFDRIPLSPINHSEPEVRGIYTTETENWCVGEINQLRHKMETTFPLKLKILPTREGKFKVPYLFISTEMPNWINGSLIFEVTQDEDEDEEDIRQINSR